MRSAAVAGVNGLRVFLDFDQAGLDAAYDQSVYAPNQREVQRRWLLQSAAARTRLGEPRRLAYGKSAIEMLDVFPARSARAPVQIYIHGGAWRSGLAVENAAAAEMFHDAGAVFVVPDFTPVQDATDSLRSMVEQVRRAIAWVYRHAAEIGGDAERIYVSAHSSGAHLGGAALITDWQRDHGVPDDIIKGALLCSGMYDLKGPRLSARSNYVKFDDAMEEALSAQRHLCKIRTPAVIAFGTLESPEFQRQSREFAAAMTLAGRAAELIVAEGYNHFELRETLASPYGILGRAALAQMKLSITGN